MSPSESSGRPSSHTRPNVGRSLENADDRSADRDDQTMAHRALDKLVDIADQLRGQAAEAERIRRLPDETAKMLKTAGVDPVGPLRAMS